MFEELKKQEPKRLFRSLTDGQVFEERIRGPHTVYVRETPTGSKELHFSKATPIGDVPVEPVTLIFDKDAEAQYKDRPLSEWESNSWAEAEEIAQALYQTIPQGIRWKVIIELMKREQRLYAGIDHVPRDHELIDWLEGMVRSTEISIYEQGGAAVLDFKQSIDSDPVEVINRDNPGERIRIDRPPTMEVTGRFRGRTVRDVLNQAATYENVSAEDVARAARDFLETLSRNESLLGPATLSELRKLAEKRYGPLPDPPPREPECPGCVAAHLGYNNQNDRHDERCKVEQAAAATAVAEGDAYPLHGTSKVALTKQGLEKVLQADAKSAQAILDAPGHPLEKPKRSPGEVLDKILALIPETETSFRVRLEKIGKDARYQTPETVHRFLWEGLTSVINHEIDKPIEELNGWQLQVVGLLINEDPLARTKK
jgi:hypothetical protein